MRRKVGVLTFWVTVVYWLGNSIGCSGLINQKNYEVLTAEAVSTTAPLTQPAPSPPQVAMPANVRSIQGNPEPSLNGLDRSHWQTMEVQPISGTVWHRPVYFKNDQIAHGDTRWQAGTSVEALGTGEAGTLYSTAGAWAVVSEPAEFFIDLVLLPYRMVRTPPWVVVTTPESAAQ